MNPAFLWAKSKRAGEPEHLSMRLQRHLEDVLEAATRVLDLTGDEQLQALGLDPERYRDRLRRCVRLAAALHDLGKANDHFQDMILGCRDVREHPQGLRHEWATVLMLKSLTPWVLPAVHGSDLDFAIVEWAIAGHHPAHDHESPPAGPPKQGGSGPEIALRIDCSDFTAILQWIASQFRLTGAPAPFGSPKRQLNAGDVFGFLRAWSKSSRRAWDSFSSEDQTFVAAVKGCLIAADVAGSALPKARPNDAARWDWINGSFSNLPELDDLQRIADHRLNGDLPRKFQRDVAASQSPVTYVKAGCGTGKTVAAYLWAAANYPTRRLYFCYPTTGTATEGFRDYLYEPDGELGDLGARLFHSRRNVDFEIILGTGADSQNPESDMAARLESLEAWSTPIAACTVDTVLGLVQNNRRGLFAWPALAQSAFVFDEIHAYDDRLFGTLLRFLRNLPGLPCLLMTASLPKAREAALFRTIRDVHGFDLEPIPGPEDLEKRPRYHQLAVPDNDPIPLIERELNTGGKVLWVCNTVGRVMNAADRAKGLGPLIYHSRFRYEDRVERHKRVVEAFTPEHQGRALAICSQVAEMSLDLKGCTLLVTDHAPVPSVIQRLGRLNRHARAGDATRPFVVIEPDTYSPYVDRHGHPDPPGWPEAARSWLARLQQTDITQRDLVEAWKQAAEIVPLPSGSCWLDGGPRTTVTELREASPGITVLMEADRPRAQADPKALPRLLLPMPPPPRSLDWEAKPREKGIAVARAGTIKYDPVLGADWNRRMTSPMSNATGAKL